jgi:hypothetical protein
MKKLLAIFTQSSSCSLGHGSFQQIPQGQEIHPLHLSQASEEVGPPTQQNNDSIPDSPSGA